MISFIRILGIVSFCKFLQDYLDHLDHYIFRNWLESEHRVKLLYLSWILKKVQGAK